MFDVLTSAPRGYANRTRQEDAASSVYAVLLMLTIPTLLLLDSLLGW